MNPALKQAKRTLQKTEYIQAVLLNDVNESLCFVLTFSSHNKVEAIESFNALSEMVHDEELYFDFIYNFNEAYIEFLITHLPTNEKIILRDVPAHSDHMFALFSLPEEKRHRCLLTIGYADFIIDEISPFKASRDHMIVSKGYGIKGTREVVHAN